MGHPSSRLDQATAWRDRLVAVHMAAALWIAAMLLLAWHSPVRYESMLEEDRFAEWLTATLFLVAGITGLVRAVRARRVFDLLVAIFCIVAAGEEISWGQRLMGYTPPALFLEHNRQQELTLHNLPVLVERPKWALMAVLAAYGLLLPLAVRLARSRPRLAPLARLGDRLGVTSPPAALAPWFAAAIGLLFWYPAQFTGEWVELLSAWLFLGALSLPVPSLAMHALVAAGAAAAFTVVSASRRASPALTACVQSETSALARWTVAREMESGELSRSRAVHKRVWTAVQDGYVDGAPIDAFESIEPCPGESAGGAGERRRFAVDPWGTAYWIRGGRQQDGRMVIYSFGANRRRDHAEGAHAGGDDIVAVMRLVSPAVAP